MRLVCGRTERTTTFAASALRTVCLFRFEVTVPVTIMMTFRVRCLGVRVMIWVMLCYMTAPYLDPPATIAGCKLAIGHAVRA